MRQGDWRRWGGHPGYCQLVQIAEEVEPLGTVGLESANKIRPTVGGKAPQGGFKEGSHEEAPETLVRDGNSL